MPSPPTLTVRNTASMITYLYHKRHRITGLNYFGKTKRDPYLYNGSGVYWFRHLQKHGKDIETVQVWKFTDLNECSKFAIQFSENNNIVESKEWANLCPENGLAGGNKFIHMSDERLAEIHQKRIDKANDRWKTRDRTEQAKSVSNIWAARDEETLSAIKSKISNTLRNKTAEEREADLIKRRKTTDQWLPITCPHCGLMSKGLSNMRRYHFDNCKLSPRNNFVG